MCRSRTLAMGEGHQDVEKSSVRLGVVFLLHLVADTQM